MSHIHVKQPLHKKCHHVTAPVLVNNRFQVLAPHADTSDAVLDDTIVNKAMHQEYRACKQQVVDTKNSDVGIDKLYPACKAVPIGLQISKKTSSCTCVQNSVCPSTVSVSNMQPFDVLQSSKMTI